MANNTIKVNEPPKIPTLNFGPKFSSAFGKTGGIGSKVASQGKFNQSSFQTQHKGGPAGGGGGK